MSLTNILTSITIALIFLLASRHLLFNQLSTVNLIDQAYKAGSQSDYSNCSELQSQAELKIFLCTNDKNNEKLFIP